MKKIISAMLILIMVLGIAVPARAENGYTISKDSATIKIGESVKLSVKLNDQTVSDVIWASNDTSVATVDKNGKVTGVAAGSTTIVGVVNGNMVESVISVIKNTTKTTTRYNVLILDNSGSMKGKPFSKEKAAAKRFCKAVLKSDGKNYIALVMLNHAGSSETACKFTASYKKIAAAIDKQKKTNSYSNIDSGLSRAGKLLKNVSGGSNVMKNVILCSDGLPNKSDTLKKGRYKKKDNKKHYAYANKDYKTDTVLKKRGYFIYALGFYQNAKGNNLVFGKRHMKDLASKDKYYEIDKPEDFKKVFDDVTKSITSIVINKEKLTLEEGQSDRLYCTKDGKETGAKWKSSNSNIVKVDENGKITACKAGACVITADCSGKKVKCKVKVTKKKQEAEEATLKVSPDSITVYVGKSKTITAYVTGPSRTVKWSSANKKIAAVNSNGTITGVKAGETTVYAKANGLKAAVKVKVLTKHPDRSFFIEHDPVVTKVGPEKVNESGAIIKCNDGGVIEKCGVYLYSSGGYERFIAACKGTGLMSVEIDCYLGRDGKMIYDYYNTQTGRSYPYTWKMHHFYMRQDSDGIWSFNGYYGNVYFNIVDLSDNLVKINRADVDSEYIKVFDSLDKLKAWLKE